MIEEKDWVWCGVAGHFVAGHMCRLHLSTRVGDYRISTVGDYHPPNYRGSGVQEEPKQIGGNRLYETLVFPVEGEGEHGEGEVTDWCEIDSEGYNDMLDAEKGHMEFCYKYARLQ